MKQILKPRVLMSNTISEEQKSSLHWQKVSPWALLYFVVYFSVRFVKDGLLNLLPMLVVFVTQVENKLFWAQVAGGAALITLLVYSFLYYLNFKFCISDDHEILLNKGYLKKSDLRLNLAVYKTLILPSLFILPR